MLPGDTESCGKGSDLCSATCLWKTHPWLRGSVALERIEEGLVKSGISLTSIFIIQWDTISILLVAQF